MIFSKDIDRLMRLVKEGKIEVLEAWFSKLDDGVRDKLLQAKDFFGHTALDIAIERNNDALVEFLTNNGFKQLFITEDRHTQKLVTELESGLENINLEGTDIDNVVPTESKTELSGEVREE